MDILSIATLYWLFYAITTYTILIDQFVSNDCDLAEDKLWLITGPNMGGVAHSYHILYYHTLRKEYLPQTECSYGYSSTGLYCCKVLQYTRGVFRGASWGFGIPKNFGLQWEQPQIIILGFIHLWNSLCLAIGNSHYYSMHRKSWWRSKYSNTAISCSPAPN